MVSLVWEISLVTRSVGKGFPNSSLFSSRQKRYQKQAGGWGWGGVGGEDGRRILETLAVERET